MSPQRQSRRQVQMPPAGTRASVSAVAALLLLATALPLSAQTIRGRIVDGDTGQPIAGGVVTVFADARPIGRPVADTAGRFRADLPSAGTYTLRAEMLGYTTVDSMRVDVTGLELVDVVIRMSRTAIPLDAIVVEGRREDPRHLATYEGFYARRESLPPIGNRRAVHRDDPEMANAMSVPDVLKWFPPIRGCTVHYVNGRDVPYAQLQLVLELPMSHIEGIEYYRSGAVDAPLGLRSTTRCTVVAIWLRRAGR